MLDACLGRRSGDQQWARVSSKGPYLWWYCCSLQKGGYTQVFLFHQEEKKPPLINILVFWFLIWRPPGVSRGWEPTRNQKRRELSYRNTSPFPFRAPAWGELFDVWITLAVSSLTSSRRLVPDLIRRPASSLSGFSDVTVRSLA